MFLSSGCFFRTRNKKEYETNHKFSSALKILPSLAFEKEEEIENFYSKIVEKIRLVCDFIINYEKMQKMSSSALILEFGASRRRKKHCLGYF